MIKEDEIPEIKENENYVEPCFCWVCGNTLNEIELGIFKCSKCDAKFASSKYYHLNFQSLDLFLSEKQPKIKST